MEEFLRIFGTLDKQCRYYCRHLGHLKGLVENADWQRVVDGSQMGRVLLLGNSEIINALILFSTRMLDKDSDAFSIYRLSRNLPTEQEIETYHSARMEELGVDYSLENHFCARSKFVVDRRALTGSTTETRLRRLRDYSLAHNFEADTSSERATLNDLIQLTEQVNELIGLAGYIVDSQRSSYSDLSNRAERETRMLYAALPVLATIERS